MFKKCLILVFLLSMGSRAAHADPQPATPALSSVLWRVGMVGGMVIIASSGLVIATAATQAPTLMPEHKRIGVAVVAGVGFAIAATAASAGYIIEGE